jgi:integrase/recombinase XerC
MDLKRQDNIRIADAVFRGLDVRPNTRQDYRYRIKHYLDFIEYQPLSAHILLDYKNALRADDTMSIATKNKYLTCARAFLREVQRLTPNLAFQFNTKVKNFQQNKKHKVFGLDEAEVMRLCQWMNANPNKMREHALLCLLLFQGLRSFEVCNLNYYEIDLIEGVMLVQSKGMDDKDIVHLHPQTKLVLERYMKQRQSALKPSDKYLFVSGRRQSWDEKLSVRGLRYIIKGIFAEVGIDRTVHGCRHYFTTHLIKNLDGSLLQVAQFTRHKSVETLQIYNDSILEKEDVTRYQNAFNDVAYYLTPQPA